MAFYLGPVDVSLGNGVGYFFREDKEKKPGRPVVEGNIDLSGLQRLIITSTQTPYFEVRNSIVSSMFLLKAYHRALFQRSKVLEV